MPSMPAIAVYCLEDDAGMVSSFLQDVAAMSSRADRACDVVCRYRSYRRFGHWDVRITGAAGVSMTPLPRLSPGDGAALRHDLEGFVASVAAADARVLVLQMHGGGYYLATKPRAGRYAVVVDATELAALLRRTGGARRWDAVLLDSCYMSTLEMAHELRGCARYLMACQPASPYLGLLSAAAGARPGRADPLPWLRAVAEGFLRRDERPAGGKAVTVVDLAALGPLADIAARSWPRLEQACRADPARLKVARAKDCPYFDLLGALRGVLQGAERRAAERAFARAVVLHLTSIPPATPPAEPRLQGLSVCVDHGLDPHAGGRYSRLSFRAHCDDTQMKGGGAV